MIFTYQPKPERGPMDKSWGSFWQDASDDFKACWAAGVEMECETTESESGVQITMRTKHPCGVVRDPNGRTTVYIRSGE